MPKYPLETMFVHPIWGWGWGVNRDCSLSDYVTGPISIQPYHLRSHVFEPEAMSCAVCGHCSSNSRSIQLISYSYCTNRTALKEILRGADIFHLEKYTAIGRRS
jgi:hypothetical protein